MAIKPRSAKNKGKRLQNEVRDLLLETFPHLEPDDILSTTMGDHGEDIKLSPAARRAIPFSFEMKNQEKISIWQCIEQAAANSKGHKPALIFRRNKSKTYCVLEVEDFMDLIKSVWLLNQPVKVPVLPV